VPNARCFRKFPPGGSVKCKVPDCPNRAKTKGVCWSHGGGTICSVAHCTTIAVSNGVCWAHGGGTPRSVFLLPASVYRMVSCLYDHSDPAVGRGFAGKRCVMPRCNRPAYERTGNMCTIHFEAVQGDGGGEGGAGAAVDTN